MKVSNYKGDDSIWNFSFLHLLTVCVCVHMDQRQQGGIGSLLILWLLDSGCQAWWGPYLLSNPTSPILLKSLFISLTDLYSLISLWPRIWSYESNFNG